MFKGSQGPALWTVERDGHRIHVFGGRPPLPMPWSAPRVEALVLASQELWNETPEIGPELQPLALAHGIDPAAPLESWLSPSDRGRLERVATTAGLAPPMLAPFRPWLAAQVVRFALESRRGTDPRGSPDAVLRAIATGAGIPVRSEFPTAEALVRFLSGVPRDAEVEWLRLVLDDLEVEPADDARRAAAWLAGDLRREEAEGSAIAQRYPSLYRHMVVTRNEAWIPRIEPLFAARTRALVVVGIGHLVGPDNLVHQLERAAFRVSRI